MYTMYIQKRELLTAVVLSKPLSVLQNCIFALLQCIALERSVQCGLLLFALMQPMESSELQEFMMLCWCTFQTTATRLWCRKVRHICHYWVWSVFEVGRKAKLEKNQSTYCREDPENDNSPYWVEYEVVIGGVHMGAELAWVEGNKLNPHCTLPLKCIAQTKMHRTD